MKCGSKGIKFNDNLIKRTRFKVKGDTEWWEIQSVEGADEQFRALQFRDDVVKIEMNVAKIIHCKKLSKKWERNNETTT